MEKPQILRLVSVTSTQDVARELPVGSIVVADYQSAGRGRYDRRWEAPIGSALLVSFVLQPRALLSLAAGIAAARACGPNVRLKWPNDLLLKGSKLGGILVEVTEGKAICGIGINLTSSPEGGAALHVPREELLQRLRSEIEMWVIASDEEILKCWRELSDTLGRRVQIQVADQIAEGVASDLGSHGELIVDGVAYVAGSVTHLP